MISIEEIDKAILELEAKDTSFAVAERLAWLYTVKDHLKPADVKTTDELKGSEFYVACSNIPYVSLMRVLNEHIECVKLLYPKEYELLIRKIKELKNVPTS